VTIDDIEWLIAETGRRDIAELQYSRNGVCIVLKKPANPSSSSDRTVPLPAPIEKRVVRSPGMGIFRSSHPGDTSPALQERAEVGKDTIVGYLDLVPGLEMVRAQADGVIGRILVNDAQLVGYGEPLLELAD